MWRGKLSIGGLLRANSKRGIVLQSVQHNQSEADLPTLVRNSEKPDTLALEQENAQLRNLVVQLSNIVVRVVVKND